MTSSKSLFGSADLEKPELQPLLASKTEGRSLLEYHPRDDELFEQDPHGRYPHLDMIRIACVCFVAIDHGCSTFGVFNSLFTQNWVLQYLFLVCGVCFAMTSKSLASYCLRLLCYFLVGVAVNWIAFVATGKDWRGNFFGVVFQFWFLVGLMFTSVVLAPVKHFCVRTRARLSAKQSQEESPERSHPTAADGPVIPQDEVLSRDLVLKFVTIMIGGPLLIALIFNLAVSPVLQLLAPSLVSLTRALGDGASLWLASDDMEGSKAVLHCMSTYISSTCCSVFIVLVYPRFFKDVSVVGWLVITNIYIHRCLYYRGADERPFHFIDLMLMGIVCYLFGLKWRKQISDVFVRYWFLMIFACVVLWPPGGYGRFDEHPPHDAEMRVRYNVIECLFVVAFFIGGQRMVDPGIFTEDKLGFMNDWALIVFLVHKACHIMLIRPLNWVVLIALAPGCWWYRQT